MMPENNSKISLWHVRIGYHRHPELVIERKEQIR
jgi:hypothetical protein